jgi:hypothetical protein
MRRRVERAQTRGNTMESRGSGVYIGSGVLLLIIIILLLLLIF